MRRTPLPLAVALSLALMMTGAAGAADRTNPLDLRMPDGTRVENCADPTVIRGQGGNDTAWYLYCTKDPLHDADKDAFGNWRFHLIPVFRSEDLVHWTYQRDAFDAMPAWVEPGSGLWAPEIAYFSGKYHLYYAAPDVKASVSGQLGCGSDAAIGVATSNTPVGPFTDKGSPVVAPRRSASGCSFYLTIDPDVIVDPSGQKWIYYGNFNGGVEVRTLSPNGLTSDPVSAVRVIPPDRAEAPEVIQRDGWYYLFHSVAGCCDGPMSGYAVLVGRSASPTGPFSDRDGVSLLDARNGGTPVLAFDGAYVGTGHETIFTDRAGQDWTIYHAIDDDDPYFEGSVGFTRRPPFLDPLDWSGGWPTVRGGWLSSTGCRQPPPVAQDGGTPAYVPSWREPDAPGGAIAAASDEFDGPALAPQWSWVRPPSSSAWGLEAGQLRVNTQSAELHGSQDNASVLVEPAPAGDWLVETKVRHTVPASGCCWNYTQAGLVIYGGDDDYLKLVHVAINGTRQTEWAKEASGLPAGYPFYGGSRVGPPGDWTWMRIVRRLEWGAERYTAWTSRDGLAWSRGATWRHRLGGGSRIGLVAMSGGGHQAFFEYVRTYALAPPACGDPAHEDPCDDDADGSGDLCDPDDDGDALADLGDCAAADAAQGVPSEVPSLLLSGGVATTLAWAPADRADRYDVIRSDLGEGAPPACFAGDVAGLEAEDATLPQAGGGFTYLVRGEDAGCGGPGTLGSRTDGSPRPAPPACPRQSRSGESTVRSSRTLPVLSVPAGSNRSTSHSSSATGRCSTPRGTTSISPSSRSIAPSRSSMRNRPRTTRNSSSSSSWRCQVNAPRSRASLTCCPFSSAAMRGFHGSGIRANASARRTFLTASAPQAGRGPR
jgi:arabinan endo-1,5-alpha-L-arabinosidase